MKGYAPNGMRQHYEPIAYENKQTYISGCANALYLAPMGLRGWSTSIIRILGGANSKNISNPMHI